VGQELSFASQVENLLEESSQSVLTEVAATPQFSQRDNNRIFLRRGWLSPEGKFYPFAPITSGGEYQEHEDYLADIMKHVYSDAGIDVDTAWERAQAEGWVRVTEDGVDVLNMNATPTGLVAALLSEQDDNFENAIFYLDLNADGVLQASGQLTGREYMSAMEGGWNSVRHLMTRGTTFESMIEAVDEKTRLEQEVMRRLQRWPKYDPEIWYNAEQQTLFVSYGDWMEPNEDPSESEYPKHETVEMLLLGIEGVNRVTMLPESGPDEGVGQWIRLDWKASDKPIIDLEQNPDALDNGGRGLDGPHNDSAYWGHSAYLARGESFKSMIETANVPGRLYHVTLTSHVQPIMKQGIRRFQTSNWAKAGSGERYGGGEVYAFENELDAIRWALNWDWQRNQEHGSGDISIITISANPDEWEVDESDPLSQSSNYGSWLRSQRAIKPEELLSAQAVTSEHIKKLIQADKARFESVVTNEAIYSSPDGRHLDFEMGWLSPTGEFYSIMDMPDEVEEHYQAIPVVMQQLGYNFTEDEAWKKAVTDGWIRIGRVGMDVLNSGKISPKLLVDFITEQAVDDVETPTFYLDLKHPDGSNYTGRLTGREFFDLAKYGWPAIQKKLQDYERSFARGRSFESMVENTNNMGDQFTSGLEKLAGEGQIMFMGPFVFVGDGQGDILAQLELSFHPEGWGDLPMLHIGFIGVSPEKRGQGNATKVLDMLASVADENGWRMTLDVDPRAMRGEIKAPMNKTQLSKWYKKFGFEKDPSYGMSRNPAGYLKSSDDPLKLGSTTREITIESVTKVEGEDQTFESMVEQRGPQILSAINYGAEGGNDLVKIQYPNGDIWHYYVPHGVYAKVANWKNKEALAAKIKSLAVRAYKEEDEDFPGNESLGEATFGDDPSPENVANLLGPDEQWALEWLAENADSFEPDEIAAYQPLKYLARPRASDAEQEDAARYALDTLEAYNVITWTEDETATYNWATIEWTDSGIDLIRYMDVLPGESKATIETAIKVFGTTGDYNEAGYLLPDGQLLDFSGKREGGTPGTRSYDHRDIGRAGGPGGTEGMMDFAADTGAIRMSVNSGTGFFDIYSRPTAVQRRIMNDILAAGGYDGYIDITKDGRTLVSTEINNPRDLRRVLSKAAMTFMESLPSFDQLLEQEWDAGALGWPEGMEDPLADELQRFYEAEYKYSAVKNAGYWYGSGTQEQVVDSYSKEVMRSGQEISAYLVPVYDDWLSKHALNEPVQWAKAHIGMARQRAEDEGYFEYQESPWNDIADSTAIDYYRYAYGSGRLPYSAYLKTPNYQPYLIRDMFAQYSPASMPAWARWVETVRKSEEQSWEGDPDNPEDAFPYTDLEDYWGNYSDNVESLSSELSTAADYLGEQQAWDMLEDIQRVMIFPGWFAHWEPKGIVDTRKRVQGVRDELYRIANGGGESPEDVSKTVNIGLNTAHQTGSMMDYIEETHPDVTTGWLQELSNRDTSDWDSVLERAGLRSADPERYGQQALADLWRQRAARGESLEEGAPQQSALEKMAKVLNKEEYTDDSATAESIRDILKQVDPDPKLKNGSWILKQWLRNYKWQPAPFFYRRTPVQYKHPETGEWRAGIIHTAVSDQQQGIVIDDETEQSFEVGPDDLVRRGGGLNLLLDRPRRTVRQAVEQFTQAKAAGGLKKDEANLDSYKTFHDLLKKLDELEPEDFISQRSVKKGKVDIDAAPGVDLVAETKNFKAYQVTSTLGCRLLGRGTKWCTTDPQTARQYLDSGPLFVIYAKQGEHPDRKIGQMTRDGSQFMDVDDEEWTAKQILDFAPPDFYELFDRMQQQEIADIPAQVTGAQAAQEFKQYIEDLGTNDFVVLPELDPSNGVQATANSQAFRKLFPHAWSPGGMGGRATYVSLDDLGAVEVSQALHDILDGYWPPADEYLWEMQLEWRDEAYPYVFEQFVAGLLTSIWSLHDDGQLTDDQYQYFVDKVEAQEIPEEMMEELGLRAGIDWVYDDGASFDAESAAAELTPADLLHYFGYEDPDIRAGQQLLFQDQPGVLHTTMPVESKEPEKPYMPWDCGAPKLLESVYYDRAAQLSADICLKGGVSFKEAATGLATCPLPEKVSHPKWDTLKKHRKQLSAEEREQVMSGGAVWHHGPRGEETPAVWKAVVKDKPWYITNTHRAYQVRPTLKGAMSSYHKFIKSTA